jgi:hypothetical protein
VIGIVAAAIVLIFVVIIALQVSEIRRYLRVRLM